MAWRGAAWRSVELEGRGAAWSWSGVERRGAAWLLTQTDPWPSRYTPMSGIGCPPTNTALKGRKLVQPIHSKLVPNPANQTIDGRTSHASVTDGAARGGAGRRGAALGGVGQRWAVLGRQSESCVGLKMVWHGTLHCLGPLFDHRSVCCPLSCNRSVRWGSVLDLASVHRTKWRFA